MSISVIKYLLNSDYRALINATRDLSRLVKSCDYHGAQALDVSMISRFNYGLDHSAWIAYTRIRMLLYFKIGDITQSWQLGNNLLYMMKDKDPATALLHQEITAARGAQPPATS
jgi:hypothetical protein